MRTVLILICTLELLANCRSYRIFGIFPLKGYSHMLTFERLMKGLAARGHQVDVVSPFRLDKPFPNYTEIFLPSPLEKIESNITFRLPYEVTRQNNKDLIYDMITNFGNLVCEKGLENRQLQNIINNPPKKQPYDLVIVEIFTAHCFMAFGHHLNIPVIGISSSALYPFAADIISNPENLAVSANNLLGLTHPLNFWNRLYNTLHSSFFKYYYQYYSSVQTDIIRKHFGPNMPGVRELEKNVALILVNSHPVLQGMVPKTPALVEVGGLHIHDDGKKIPADHKKWLDESDAGFVYFTFGSMIEIESFPQDVLETFYNSFSKISPVRVLMKIMHPEKLPPGLPENIQTFTWIPQFQVLKHKNIRAVITHGGMMGLQEALTFGIPIIGVPLIADQFLNVALSVKNKMGIQLNLREISEESLDNALNEILHNPLYREAAKKMSDKFLDRPMSALDTACYWVEYIGRHGSGALRSPAMDLAWWQVALLDVYLTILLFCLLFFIVLMIITRFLINFCQSSFQKKNNHLVKKNN